MNRPLNHLERSGAAVRDYWLVTIPPMPPAQAGVIVPPSTSITRALFDAVIVAEEHRLAQTGTWQDTTELVNKLNSTLRGWLLDATARVELPDTMPSLVLPKKVSRLQVITRQRGKGTFLPYD